MEVESHIYILSANVKPLFLPFFPIATTQPFLMALTNGCRWHWLCASALKGVDPPRP